MSVPEPPQPPRPRNLWWRILRRAVPRLVLPLVVLVALIAGGLYAMQSLPSLTGQGTQESAKPSTKAPAGAQQSQPSQQKPALKGAPTPTPIPRTGPELRVMMPNVSTLDPGLAYDSDTIPVVQLLFEGLLAVDAQGTLSARGAQRWDVSRDGSTYTFYLDPQARWSDGQSVKAADYVFAWRRNLNPQTRSPYAVALYPLKNGQAINQGRVTPEQLGVEARDDHTLVVTLEGPAPYFPSLVATWTYYPLRQDVLQRFGTQWSQAGNIVGNGPYVLEGVGGGEEVVLGRNQHYAGPRPPMDRIVFKLFTNLGQALDAFRTGELEIMPYSPQLKDVISGDPVFQQAVKTYPRSGTAFVVVNHRRKAMQDARVRRALGMALDRAEIVTQILGGAGRPATSLHPPGIAGRDEAAWPRESVAEAKRLLAEAGYPDGKGLELVMAIGSAVDPLGPALQQRWRDTLGVTIRLLPVDSITALRQAPQWTNEMDLYAGSWQSDYEDPHNWFNLLWDSQHDPGQYNSGWRNADFDRLVRQGQTEQDLGRRTGLYQQAERIMAQEYPLIPLYYPSEQYLVRPEVQGFQPGGTALAVPLLGVRLTGGVRL
jgi:oligopeptide transport system substrate-binding protein